MDSWFDELVRFIIGLYRIRGLMTALSIVLSIDNTQHNTQISHQVVVIDKTFGC